MMCNKFQSRVVGWLGWQFHPHFCHPIATLLPPYWPFFCKVFREGSKIFYSEKGGLGGICHPPHLFLLSEFFDSLLYTEFLGRFVHKKKRSRNRKTGPGAPHFSTEDSIP